ncbi:pyridoxal phosphate-dependent aminotransferase [Myxococcota bacterium]|nr:pyridoxal phosphate-dependent aminotransferase [Myxococcota bacterium]MBU1380249.1 pyridoxal phosphate-dependent aminotransferase [Myxococcota bacterium]MBU1496363.1 pyridoxal phosphate-dependent aminotransferase [Myxococcota bacterium]
MQLSQRSSDIPYSPIRKLLPFEVEAVKRGIKIYKLNIGQPDIATPAPFFTSLGNDLPEVLGYGPSQGLPEFRKAVSDYYKRLNIPFEPDEIIATVGGSEALFFAFLAVANPGDEIIVFEPFYTNYIGFAVYSGVTLVPYTLKAENGFHLPAREEITRLITPKTKAILSCSPNNPTGTVFTQAEIEMLADIALEHGLFIISDEVYREFSYTGQTPPGIMSVSRIWDQAIVVDSISKRFSACGARIGNFATKNRCLYDSVLRFGQARLCPATAEQLAAVSLYSMSDDYFESVREEYRRRRDAVMKGLGEIDGIVCHSPDGAFYIMAALPIDDGDRFAKWLLTDFSHEGETVMVAPGAGFYATAGMGKNEIRLAYVLEAEKCTRAMEILKVAVEKYIKEVM